MELRQLRYLVAIDDARNLSRAAERLFVSQPALSYALRTLEREMADGDHAAATLRRYSSAIPSTPNRRCLRSESRLRGQGKALSP